jgi:8-oxo-dGTP pyrophosphatase MutT (NUDIX family)
VTKNEFLQHFQFNSLAESSHKYKYLSGINKAQLKQAAVLVALVDHGKHITVLLTKRASQLRHHGGQISFPGGRVDNSDNDLIFTATREAHEEIALLPQHCEIIGQLHPYQTISGYVVTPIVAFIPAKLELQANIDEVDEIFEVPLAHFLNNNNTQSVRVKQQNHSYQVYFMPYNHYNIWGATAAIMKDLIDHIR